MRTPLSESVANAVLRRRWTVLLTLTALAVLLGVGATRLRADFTPDDMFRGIDDHHEVSTAFQDAFGNTDNVVLLLVEAPDVLALDVLQYVHDATLHFRGQALADYAVGITTVAMASRATGELQVRPLVAGATVSADEARAIAAATTTTPLLDGKLVARDRTVTVVAIVLARGAQRLDELRPSIAAIQRWVDEHAPPPGARARLGGMPVVRVDLIGKMEADQTTLFPAAFAVCLLILLASFRWLPALVLPPVAVGLSALLLVGGMGWAGESLNIVNNIVPLLIIVIGLSDSIHLLNRYGEHLDERTTTREASRRALRSMTAACFLTSLTTAIGFASLVVSELEILRRFGIVAALGVLVAFAVTVGFLPVALSFAPRPRRAIADHRHGAVERLLAPLVSGVLRRRWAVVAIAGALLLASAHAARSLPVDTAVHEQYDPDDPAFATLRLLEDKLDGVRPFEVSLVSERPGRFDDAELLHALEHITAWARQRPGVLSATSYSDLLRQTRVTLSGDERDRTAPYDPARTRLLAGLLEAGAASQARGFVTVDRTRTRINIQMKDVGGRATLAFADRLTAELARVLAPFPDVRAELTGEGYVAARGLDVVTRDLLASLLLAIAVIFAVMTALFRSLRLGLISVPPNLLPLVFTMAYMKARGIPLNLATVIIFSISIGLAVDGTIHMLSRFVEESRAGKRRDRALLESARGTGKAVVVSYLSLMIGFGILQLSQFVPIRRFGELIAVTAFGCLVSTVALLPALIGVAWPARRRPPESGATARI